MLLFHQRETGLHLFEVALARLPGGDLPRLTREDDIDRTHQSLGPLAPLLCCKALLLHRLHHVARKNFAFNERASTKCEALLLAIEFLPAEHSLLPDQDSGVSHNHIAIS